MEDFFDHLEKMGAKVYRLTPLQGDLLRNYPLEFNSEINATDLYWNYFVRVEYGEYGCRCERYATNYKDAVQGLLNMPKGKITIITFHDKIMKELKEKRKYKYFYN